MRANLVLQSVSTGRLATLALLALIGAAICISPLRAAEGEAVAQSPMSEDDYARLVGDIVTKHVEPSYVAFA